MAATVLQNATAKEPRHLLVAPPGPPVPGLPTNLRKLSKLSATTAAALEAAYKLQPGANETLRERRRAIARYLGVQVQV